jgi:hypothetical protein
VCHRTMDGEGEGVSVGRQPRLGAFAAPTPTRFSFHGRIPGPVAFICHLALNGHTRWLSRARAFQGSAGWSVNLIGRYWPRVRSKSKVHLWRRLALQGIPGLIQGPNARHRVHYKLSLIRSGIYITLRYHPHHKTIASGPFGSAYGNTSPHNSSSPHETLLAMSNALSSSWTRF